MSADLLLAIERMHLLRLGAWGAACLLAGTVLLALLALRRQRSPLVFHFGVQTALWGAVVMLMAAVTWQRLAPRDYAAATHLDRVLWLTFGAELGLAGVGLTLAIAGWRFDRRLGAIGAGLGLAVQGLALATLGSITLAAIGSGI